MATLAFVRGRISRRDLAKARDTLRMAAPIILAEIGNRLVIGSQAVRAAVVKLVHRGNLQADLVLEFRMAVPAVPIN